PTTIPFAPQNQRRGESERKECKPGAMQPTDIAQHEDRSDYEAIENEQHHHRALGTPFRLEPCRYRERGEECPKRQRPKEQPTNHARQLNRSCHCWPMY